MIFMVDAKPNPDNFGERMNEWLRTSMDIDPRLTKKSDDYLDAIKLLSNIPNLDVDEGVDPDADSFMRDTDANGQVANNKIINDAMTRFSKYNRPQ